MTHIGPDLSDYDAKWDRGAITDSGVIYCPPIDDRGILKIDTNTDDVTELNVNLLPERGNYICRSRWMYLLHASSCSSYHEARSK